MAGKSREFVRYHAGNGDGELIEAEGVRLLGPIEVFGGFVYIIEGDARREVPLQGCLQYFWAKVGQWQKFTNTASANPYALREVGDRTA